MTDTPDRLIKTLLDRGFSELGEPLSPLARERLVTLGCELERWSARINLTGHRDAETITRRLVLDAGALLQRLPPFDSLADLGSGAGFPGLPMAVLEPARHFVLVESRERRHFFQREIVRKLELQNVALVRGRFEHAPAEACDLVIAQAVARPAVLVPAMLRWSRPGGLLVVPGGESAEAAALDRRVDAPRSVEYRVPLGGPRRTAWLARAP